MHKLIAHSRDKVIDLLSERLTFERSGVKIYDAILKKLAADAQVARLLPELEHHRDQEQEHADWLERQIQDLGGDARQRSELAQLVTTESEGIAKVVEDDKDTFHLLHALLVAELVDNSGWQLLMELADEADDDDARRSFKQFLHEEEEHLILARRAVSALARKEVLGLQAPMLRVAS